MYQNGYALKFAQPVWTHFHSETTSVEPSFDALKMRVITRTHAYIPWNISKHIQLSNDPHIRFKFSEFFRPVVRRQPIQFVFFFFQVWSKYFGSVFFLLY